MAKFEISITEVGPRTFGHDGRGVGMVVRLSGHWSIEGREVARFTETYREICEKCQGTGFLPHYAGIYSGQCFPCGGRGVGATFGTGSVLELGRKLRNRAQAAERREAKRAAEFAAKQAKMAEEFAAWKSAHAELLPAVAKYSAMEICEHLGGNGPCYREACVAARDAAREVTNGTLIDLAYTATYRALSAADTKFFVELLAKQAVRDEKLAARKVATAAKGWVGAEGEKVSVTGVLAKPFHVESSFGYQTRTSTIYRLTTAEGNTVSWFRTGFHMFEAGETVTLTGTVKALKETEKYGKETQLTRCKIS